MYVYIYFFNSFFKLSRLEGNQIWDIENILIIKIEKEKIRKVYTKNIKHGYFTLWNCRIII